MTRHDTDVDVFLDNPSPDFTPAVLLSASGRKHHHRIFPGSWLRAPGPSHSSQTIHYLYRRSSRFLPIFLNHPPESLTYSSPRLSVILCNVLVQNFPPRPQTLLPSDYRLRWCWNSCYRIFVIIRFTITHNFSYHLLGKFWSPNGIETSYFFYSSQVLIILWHLVGRDLITFRWPCLWNISSINPIASV